MILGITPTTLLFWAIFGFAVGLIVSAIDSGTVRGGILGTTVLGILGAVFGGFLSTILFGNAVLGFSVEGFLTAVLGGLILSFLYRLAFRKNEHIKITTIQL